MKNHIGVTFLLISSFWKIGLSVNIEDNAAKNNNNLENEKKIRNVRDSLNKVIDKNIGGIPISEIAAYTGKMRNLQSGNYDDKNGYYNDSKGLFERNGYNFEFDSGNPDIHGEILRPCQAYDTFCIRKFFAEHSKCSISGRPVPDPLYRADGSINFASSNISETQVTADYGGLNNARISEFYINKVTDNLVIAVTFDRATKFSNNTYVKFYLRGREPIVTRDAGGIQFGVLTVTVIIPHIKNLTLDRSEIYTYGDNNLFAFGLGPRIGASTDTEVTSMYARFYANIPPEYQEEISNQGHFLVGNYIQYNICDFGIKFL